MPVTSFAVSQVAISRFAFSHFAVITHSPNAGFQYLQTKCFIPEQLHTACDRLDPTETNPTSRCKGSTLNKTPLTRFVYLLDHPDFTDSLRKGTSPDLLPSFTGQAAIDSPSIDHGDCLVFLFLRSWGGRGEGDEGGGKREDARC